MICETLMAIKVLKFVLLSTFYCVDQIEILPSMYGCQVGNEPLRRVKAKDANCVEPVKSELDESLGHRVNLVSVLLEVGLLPFAVLFLAQCSSVRELLDCTVQHCDDRCWLHSCYSVGTQPQLDSSVRIAVKYSV
jgi:hypothetical protein